MQKHIPLLITTASYLSPMGMLYYFFLRQLFIKKITDLDSIKKKVRLLGIIQIILFLSWACLVAPQIINTVVASGSYELLKLCGYVTYVFTVFVAGAEFAKWLTHDDEFNEQLDNKYKK
jgi:hypothetical protein